LNSVDANHQNRSLGYAQLDYGIVDTLVSALLRRSRRVVRPKERSIER